MRIPLYHDPLARITQWFVADGDGKFRFETEQNVDHIIEANKQDKLDTELTRRGIKGDWWKYARVPDTVWIGWRRDKGIDIWDKAHRKDVFKLLNDPDWSHLKTTDKRHAG